MKAKFELKDMLVIGLTFVVTVIGISYGISVTADIRDDFTANSAERNATESGIEALAKLPQKMPLIATVVIAANGC